MYLSHNDSYYMYPSECTFCPWIVGSEANENVNACIHSAIILVESLHTVTCHTAVSVDCSESKSGYPGLWIPILVLVVCTVAFLGVRECSLCCVKTKEWERLEVLAASRQGNGRQLLIN